MKNYLMVLQYGSMDEYLYRDILALDHVREFQISAPDLGKICYMLRKVHTSTFATKYFDPPFKSVWYQKQLLKEIDDSTYVLFQMSAMIHVGFHTIRAIKKRNPGAKLILILVDSINAYSYSMKYAKRFIFGYAWDVILSFDRGDCEKFGFTYLGLSYYSRLKVSDHLCCTSDLYYIGAEKDEDTRIPLLADIYNACEKSGVSCNFNLLTQRMINIAEGIKIIRKGIPYEEVVSDLASSKCILELVQPGQHNQTARYMEAICYNKKLLTNNKAIKELPYYNPDYMKIFDTPDQINFAWLKEKMDVDYRYNGDFSPVKILTIIEDTINERKGKETG